MSCQPLNTPANPQQVRDALRKKFEKRADYILDELGSRSQVSYDCGALRELGILLHHVDLTTDQELPDYKPLSRIEYSKYKIDSARVPEHLRHHYDCFDDAFHWPSSLPRPDTELLYEKAFQIVTYINILRDYTEKDDSMEESSNWYQILAEDSFVNGPQGMLYGLRTGHSKPLNLSKWRAVSYCQWQEDPENPDTIRPHIMLMVCTGAVAKSNELLHGEIGPIINVIQCRLFQEEFEQTSSFPVLVISLFGARQGRILHTHFNIDGTLIVRASDIFNFEKKNQEGFDLFMRYYNCELKDVAEFDSIAPPTRSPSPPITVGRTSQSGDGGETSITSPWVSENVPYRASNMGREQERSS